MGLIESLPWSRALGWGCSSLLLALRGSLLLSSLGVAFGLQAL